MIKRLVWNFELCLEKPIDFERLENGEEDVLSWEARYFWPDTAIIPIKGMSENFLDLSQYKIKHREDLYFLSPDGQSNIKKRKGSLWYKPLQQKRAHLSGFAKKINLSESPGPFGANIIKELRRSNPSSALRAPSPQAWGEPNDSHLLAVDKIALIKNLDCNPPIKFELARLTIHEQIYFTACIESHAYAYVKDISEQMFPEQTTADYVHFLEQIIAKE